MTRSPCVKSPSLFYSNPDTIIGNIEGVVDRFRQHGLTPEDYLRAAVAVPQLFYQSPNTIIGNIEGVVDRFRQHGLTPEGYLRAVVQQPQLFTTTSGTIIGHVNLIIDLHRQGLVRFPGQDAAPPGQPLRPLFNWLVNHPMYFTLADENYALRDVYAHVTGQRPGQAGLLTRTRYRTEDALAAHLGHSDLSTPVPKEPSPDQGGDPGRHARNVLLRALCRAGLVKSEHGRGQIER